MLGVAEGPLTSVQLTVIFELPIPSAAHSELVLPYGQVELVEVVAEQQPLSGVRSATDRRTGNTRRVNFNRRARRRLMARSYEVTTKDDMELEKQEQQQGDDRRSGSEQHSERVR